MNRPEGVCITQNARNPRISSAYKLYAFYYFYYRIKHCFLGNYLCINSGSSLTNWIKSEEFPQNTVLNPYNSYSWTSCLFSTLNTIKEIPKESLKQWTYNTHMIINWKKSAKCYWPLWNMTNMTSLKTSSLKRKD
jgi:hypothetical protein